MSSNSIIPVSEINKDKIYLFRIRKKPHILQEIWGIENGKHYHPYVSLNKFSTKLKLIPKCAEKIKYRKEPYFSSKIYDSNKKELKRNNKYYDKIKNEHKGWKKCFIHDNFNRPFLVYYNNEKVCIYKLSTKHYYNNNFIPNYYIELVKNIKYSKIFITNNSMLLQVSDNKYVYIGYEIFEFTADKITKFESPIGNNDIPYSIGYGDKNIYFFIDKVYFSKCGIPNYDLVEYYYNNKKNIKTYPIKYKSIHKRIIW